MVGRSSAHPLPRWLGLSRLLLLVPPCTAWSCQCKDQALCPWCSGHLEQNLGFTSGRGHLLGSGQAPVLLSPCKVLRLGGRCLGAHTAQPCSLHWITWPQRSHSPRRPLQTFDILQKPWTNGDQVWGGEREREVILGLGVGPPWLIVLSGSLLIV
jgi:hypothetical protein